MSRSILSLCPEQLTSFDLEAFRTHAKALNQKHLEADTTPFPKAPSRWLSHDQFTPRPIALTREGDVDGGLSWLIGATIDLSFTCTLCAPHYGTRGGWCYDPASLVLFSTGNSLWNCPWAVPRTRPTPMRAVNVLHIAPPWPCRCCSDTCNWGTRPMTSLPTTSGCMTRVASQSLMTTATTSTSIPRLFCPEALIKTGHPMPLVVVCVAPMATTTKHKVGSMSVADSVPLKS
jgi:hypothetical protein